MKETVSDTIQPLFKLNNIKKFFPVRTGLLARTTGHVKAVDDVSFSIKNGETLGLVGESGCGKSTLGRTIIRLLEPSGGEAIFRGNNIFLAKKEDLRHLRKEMQIIFQDPYSSLNPRMNVGEIVGEGLKMHKAETSSQKQREQVEYMLEVCGLSPYHFRRYPHEFSGGQRQRIGIARALVLKPSFVVADEPIASLDVSIQAQIINLMEELKDKFGLTYLFISHDLSMVKYVSDNIAVMYLGKIVEYSGKTDLYKNPLHPYTQALISAIPVTDQKTKKKRIILKGDVPSPSNPPKGCYFHPRCKYTQERCKTEPPELRELEPGHFVACHLAG